MYTFSQLLIRNIGLALIFILSISSISLYMFSALLKSKTSDNEQIIKSFAQHFIMGEEELNNAKNFSKTLQKISKYQSLTINNLAGEQLSNFENKNIGFTFPFITPETKQVNIKELSFNIRYQLNFQEESALVLYFIITSTILSLLLIIIAIGMSVKRHRAVFRLIGQQIKNDLAVINNTLAPIENTPAHNDLLEIPELKQGIAEIKQLMAQQLENVTHLEKEAYIDHLTKLDNRSRFVQYFENQVREDSPLKFGVLSITRCSELQTINQIHGYKEGDNYIARVATLFKKQYQHTLTVRLFRLNSSDFACILPNIKLGKAEEFAQELMPYLMNIN